MPRLAEYNFTQNHQPSAQEVDVVAPYGIHSPFIRPLKAVKFALKERVSAKTFVQYAKLNPSQSFINPQDVELKFIGAVKLSGIAFKQPPDKSDISAFIAAKPATPSFVTFVNDSGI